MRECVSLLLRKETFSLPHTHPFLFKNVGKMESDGQKKKKKGEMSFTAVARHLNFDGALGG